MSDVLRYTGRIYNLVVERAISFEQERVYPDELKEVTSGLLFTQSRQPDSQSRRIVLKEIVIKNGIALQIDETSISNKVKAKTGWISGRRPCLFEGSTSKIFGATDFSLVETLWHIIKHERLIHSRCSRRYTRLGVEDPQLLIFRWLEYLRQLA